MNDVYVLFRSLRGPGGVLSVPVRSFETEEAAKRASGQRQAELTKLLDAQLAFVQGDTATPVGLTLRDFLGSFGVEAVGHEPVKLPAGVVEVPPAPRIVLA